MSSIGERLAKLEEKVSALSESIRRVEKALYGNSNPASLFQRVAKVEVEVRYNRKIMTIIISLLAAELGMLAAILQHLLG